MKYDEFKKDTVYIVTKGSDTLRKGDVICISSTDGAMIVCPRLSKSKIEQGGWIDKRDLLDFPDILNIKVKTTDKYEFIRVNRSECIRVK